MRLSVLIRRSARDFRVARNPSRVDAKCDGHFLQADFPLLIRTSKSHDILPTALYGWGSAVGSALEIRKVTLIPLARLRTSVSM